MKASLITRESAGGEIMEKLQRNERIALLLKILSDHPNQLFTFNFFSSSFNCAKSTLSEDVDILKGIVARFKMGMIETVAGAAGGVKYIPLPYKDEIKKIVEDLCNTLSDSSRVLSGGFLYMTDIIYRPDVVDSIGKIFAGQFIDREIDYVITVETKGIPIATMTAKYLNKPLVIARRDSKVTEGSSVNINYVSASSRRIQTMSLSRRAISKNSKVLFVDDFMKGGGTAQGIIELMNEFDSTVEGIAVFISTSEPQEKNVNEYFSLIILNEVNDIDKFVNLKPGIILD